MLRRTFTALTALLLTLSSASCAPAASPPTSDPYFPAMGDPGYDVAHYRIRVRMNPESGWLRGRTVITARATEELTRLRLDLALRPQTISVNGQAAQFWRERGLRLVVQPAAPVPPGTQMQVEVTYRGNPSATARTDACGYRNSASSSGTLLASPICRFRVYHTRPTVRSP